MEYLLTCACGGEITVSRSQAGQEVQCTCGRTLQVPTLRGLADLPVADSLPSVTNSAATQQSSESSWRGWRGMVMAIATLGVILSTLTAGWFLLQWSQTPPPTTTESVIAFNNEVYDSTGPDGLSYLWHDYQRYGLGRKTMPEYQLWNIYTRERLILAAIAGGVGIFFLAVASAVWINVKKKPQ